VWMWQHGCLLVEGAVLIRPSLATSAQQQCAGPACAPLHARQNGSWGPLWRGSLLHSDEQGQMALSAHPKHRHRAMMASCDVQGASYLHWDIHRKQQRRWLPK